MYKEQIKQLLEQKEITVSEIARKIPRKSGKGHIGRGVVYRTLEGQVGSSRRVRVEVALMLGRLPSVVFAGVCGRDVLAVDDLHYCDKLENKAA